jgi:tetratricopeptide (TPR) repeat protein
MQAVDEQTVLGDFNDASFTYAGVTSTFYKRDGRFFVRTDGADGALHDYEIAYTFGVRPLQQYLIAFPNGRLQPLGIAWDARPAGEGGQRWFHLYPDQNVTHGDPRHWTHRNQNWNSMCASCHSTNLRKNYEPSTDGYATAWSEINVACEACHGPGSKHVAWASARSTAGADTDLTKGLVATRRASGGGDWEIVDGTPRWTGPPRRAADTEACASCHARSRPITSHQEPGSALLDTQVPALLDVGLYHADGQVLDEVFEYGSFTQSKMHQAGVTCSDCHDPHSTRLLRGPGNATCARCHLPATFDAPSHHRHQAGTEAALCVNCHMPQKNYMVVDGRRDHSFRVPRPDLALALGTPDACTQCHVNRSRKWSADAVARWYGPNRRLEAHYATALDAGRRGLTGAERSLASVATDRTAPSIARATALSLLSDYLTPASLPAIQTGLADDQPLVRAAAVRGLAPVPSQDRAPLAAPLLSDPVRAVRIEAARVLADTPPPALPAHQRAALEQATAELIASELASADRPESHLNLSALYTQMGRANDAETSLLTALRLDPRFVPAMVNLADLYRAQSRDAAGETLLQRAMEIDADSAEAVHSLGLLRVRQQRQSEALALLKRAAALQPDVPRYGHAYALALHASGDVAGAIEQTEKLLSRVPGNPDALALLQELRRTTARTR